VTAWGDAAEGDTNPPEAAKIPSRIMSCGVSRTMSKSGGLRIEGEMQIPVIEFAKHKAHREQRDVRIAHRLREDGWVVDGSMYLTDVIVRPNGKMRPIMLKGRKLIACSI